ncbi:MAG: coproporphyrinogen III oxidase [Cytophagales bacterium CG12_big_fil_rev_8_21_14_0_65_40_12]|nr:MAG: coproporphyrinogen III oxidase [Cytophagales bacterium CG12_big_fil_rev_8_21_14_0_65_40_12]PIW04887.1 MAG: coproporphyrinogen III oxidase [Cytophagales bacterium CG17_big_fil_post_rev_8_21_14_2_50_40_13]
MAGLYIHIPFCKKACHYCDFHFTQSVHQMDEMIDAICVELELQASYFNNDQVNTIYFGGGTPSLMNEEHVKRILKQIRYYFNLSSNPEVTLEANPDDLDLHQLSFFRAAGINRLSIGIQSFHGSHLAWMNRQHNAEQSEKCFYDSRKAGFENISIDLIYALPAPNHDLWLSDLKKAVLMRPEHISSYCLTIEPKTAFGNWVAKGKMEDVEEEYAAQQFEILTETLNRYGYEQYEISNFAQPGYESQHNSNYWKQEKYLGIGPSAHSFNGNFKQANVSNNVKYLKSLAERKIPFEKIILTREDQMNEYILTSLRTKWGCDNQILTSKYGVNLLALREDYLYGLFTQGMIEIEEQCITLTNKGKLLADKIAADLFVFDELS